MYLSQLTAKGFKSFASATTITLEPGITCVVGPNGSGKSNVVDALAWVMGEQGAKSLRGGKMQDVIFAGTSGRAALGRAEVSLTINNADGALPIEYSEVTITRTMFRSGGSEYAINGQSARLLDVQELLSDSGIGREMHVIVGQNQLDAVLRATPEERRGFIEEAAGILKHRRRKEKALRKLAATAEGLHRLTDLTAEVRRQLGPLGRQAEVARRAQTIQIDVRDAGLRLLADDLAQLRSTAAQGAADHKLLTERLERVQHEQHTAQTAADLAIEAAHKATAEHTSATNQLHQLQQVHERLTGIYDVASERSRLLQAPSGPQPDRDGPARLRAQAQTLRARHQELAAAGAQQQADLQQASAARSELDQQVRAEEKRITALHAQHTRRREWIATLTGRVETAQNAVASATAEHQRIDAAHTEALSRAARAREEFAAREDEVAGVEACELGLDEAYEEAAQRVDSLQTQRTALRDRHSAAAQQAREHKARREALTLAAHHKDGTEAILGEQAVAHLVKGSIAQLLEVDPDHAAVVAAALGPLAEAIVVQAPDAAVKLITYAHHHNTGSLDVFIADHNDSPEPPQPACGHNICDHITGSTPVAHAARHLLRHTAVVPDLETAAELVQASPTWQAVTPEGAVLTSCHARYQHHEAPSTLQLQAAIDTAEEQERAATHDSETVQTQLQTVDAQYAQARQEAAAALAKLHESDAAIAAVTEQLSALAQTAKAAHTEAERLNTALTQAATDIQHRTEQLQLAHTELATVTHDTPPEATVDTSTREELTSALAAAAHHETELRLALRTQQEQAATALSKAESLERTAHREQQNLDAAEQAAQRRLQRAQNAQRIGAVAQQAIAVARAASETASTRVQQLDHDRAVTQTEAKKLSAQVNELAQHVATLTDAAHQDDIARAQHAIHLQAVEERCITDYALAPDIVHDEYGPHTMVPVTGSTTTQTPAPVPYVRSEQEKRLRTAQRELKKLGKVNPLALEEFDALTERHDFLAKQLADVEQSRKDLLEIVAEIDQRVEAVFTDAWQDTQREFGHVFDTLFPGGEGKLILTDPSDMLTTGIDVEARPAGKKVKQLSLLSGGERSLTAIALLVAIFKARPSPFYVLDEVEAALDDSNLGRLLAVLEELRQTSQLIVITHQKRTMEVADALYGVSMQGDGVSKVISQRLRSPKPELQQEK